MNSARQAGRCPYTEPKPSIFQQKKKKKNQLHDATRQYLQRQRRISSNPPKTLSPQRVPLRICTFNPEHLVHHMVCPFTVPRKPSPPRRSGRLRCRPSQSTALHPAAPSACRPRAAETKKQRHCAEFPAEVLNVVQILESKVCLLGTNLLYLHP